MICGARVRDAALVLIVAAVVGGCGELGADFRGSRPLAPAVPVIAGYPSGTPQRALLFWCRALIVGDEPLARSLTIGGLADARRLVRSRSCPRILDVQARGDGVTAFTVLSQTQIAPNGRRDSRAQLQAFELRRRDGRWRVVTADAAVALTSTTKLEYDTGSPPLPMVVTPVLLARYAPDSAERAVLELLRRGQFNDPTGARRYFAPGVVTAAQLLFIVRNQIKNLISFGGPRLTATGTDRRKVIRTAAVTVVVRRGRDGWQVASIRAGGLKLPP